MYYVFSNSGEIEAIQLDNEDVFDVDEDSDTPPTESLTFVSSAYAMLANDPDELRTCHVTYSNDHVTSVSTSCNESDNDEIFDSGFDSFNLSDDSIMYVDSKTITHGICFSNANITTGYTHEVLSLETQKPENHESAMMCNAMTNNNNTEKQNGNITWIENCQVLEEGPCIQSPLNYASKNADDQDNVCEIAVNRSYAKGDSTFSVAKRSPSPMSRRKRLGMNNGTNRRTSPHLNRQSQTTISDVTSTLQNINNERILCRLKRQNCWMTKLWNWFVKYAKVNNVDDLFLEMLLLICASTFTSLMFDMCPSSHVFIILTVLFIKWALVQILCDI